MTLWEKTLWAEDKLREGGWSPETVKHLTLIATGSPEAAEDAWAKATLNEMRKG